jgi:uncharacterized caspase-like protein
MSKLDEIRAKMRQELKDAGVGSQKPELRQSVRGQLDALRGRTGTAPGKARSAREFDTDEGALDEVQNVFDEDESAPLGVKRALFIGNNTYEENPLSKCINDAREMSAVFSDIGYQVTTAFDLTCERSRVILERFKEDIVPGDEVVFSFSGHGMQVNSENYLAPIDMHHASEAINLQKEIDDMKNCGARMILAVIDACRPQNRLDFFQTIGQLQSELAQTRLPQAKNLRQAIRGHGIVFATSHDTSAVEFRHMSNGIFTHHFLQEVRVQGRTIEQVIEAVKEKVMADTGGDQIPAFHNELSGKFYFTQ